MRRDDRETALEPVYLRTLLRVNLSTALLYFGVFLVVMIGPPVVFHFLPISTTWRVLGLPVPWFFLGFGGFPVLVAIAWRFLRDIEASEEEFSDLVDAP
jgi:hypothetical protein